MKKYRSMMRVARREAGQALIALLVFMALGAILLVPLLNYIGTGILSGRVFESNAGQYYAADAGVENGLWQIRNDYQSDVLKKNVSGVDTTYDRYTYLDGTSTTTINNTTWDYQLGSQINKYNVDIKVDNQWIPYGLPRPSPAQAHAVIEGQDDAPPKLIVSGEVKGFAKLPDGITDDLNTLIYQVTLSYTPAAGDPLLTGDLSSLGIWLPSGFSYVGGSISLASDPNAVHRPGTPTITNYKGSANGAIVWGFNNIAFDDLMGVDPNVSPLVCTFTIKVHTTDSTRSLDAVSWFTTLSTDLGLGYHSAWDGDTNVFHFNSTAVDPTTSLRTTQIDAYAIQSKMRDLNSALNGDYVAVGNSLMSYLGQPDNLRDTLLSQSSSPVNTIPQNANVQLAYLYWSGWLSANTNGSPAVPTGDGETSGVWSNSVSSADTGWLSPTSSQSFGSGNGFETNAQGANADGGTWASNSQSGDRQVFVYNTSSIPAGATILGIEVRLDWWLSSTNGNNSLGVDLSWDNGTSWTSSKTASNERTSDGNPTDTLGNSSDTWGHVWTTSPTNQLDSAHFKVRVTCNSSHTVNLDWIPIRVTYTVPVSNRYSLVDEIAPANDGDYVVGTTPDAGNSYCLFTFTPFSIPAGNSIHSLIVHVRASDNGANGDGHVTGCIKVNGSRYSGIYSAPTGSGYTDYSYEWILNPKTNQPWTLSDINGVGTNPIQQFGVASDDLNPDIRVSAVYAEVKFNLPDNTATLSINGGAAHVITANLADPSQTQTALRLDPLDGFYYGCRVDVTDLVKNESNGANLSANPKVYGNGNGNYTVGGVQADTENNASFAGWSLVIVYSSPDTKGHQVYLYDLKDTFSSVPATDGNGGPTIQLTQVTGFLVPQQIIDPITHVSESDVAKLTIFVGEGDVGINGDYVALIDQRAASEHHLWDGVTLSGTYSGQNTGPDYSNVWNGYSTGSSGSQEGVDIDTFTVKWADNELITGDTAATIKLYTDGDGYVILYKIMSFRSSITAGGTITYLIK